MPRPVPACLSVTSLLPCSLPVRPLACSFFRDRQRINVALSRARHLCVVCGHRGTLALPKAQPWGRMLGSYSRSG